MMSAGPRASLLEVIHRDDRLLDLDAHTITELAPDDLVGALARLYGRHDHLSLPDRGLRLGESPHAVTLDANQLLDRRCMEPAVHGRLDHRGVREFFVTHAIAWSRCDRTGGLTDVEEQLDRCAGLLGELCERGAAQGREALERGCIEEVQGDLSTPDGGAQALQRDA